MLAITQTPASAAAPKQTFDADADRDGVANCWFTNPWGPQSSSAGLTAGHSGRAQAISGAWFAPNASLRLAQEGRCTLPVRAGEQVRSEVWYQASGPAEMWIEARSRSGSWRMITRTVLARSGSWTRSRSPVATMPANTTAARVQFRLNGIGRLIVDDLSLDTVAPGRVTTTVTATPTPTTPSETTPTSSAQQTLPGLLLAPTFARSNGLVTNEFAFYGQGGTSALRSPDWRVTSGSLFSRDGTGWSGVPDDREPNATSSNGTNSAVFRVITQRLTAADADVRMKLRVNDMTSTGSTPPVAWDGVHLFLRYQNEHNLYSASVARRDGSVVLKKKCQGGASNGGTYYTLASRSGFAVPRGSWVSVGASVKNNANGSVRLSLQHGGRTILSAVDAGVGCSTIRSTGSLGVRGDNTDFQFGDLVAMGN